MKLSRKGRVFWPLLFVTFLADCATKELATEQLSPTGAPHEVLGELFRLTLRYNAGAAMGLPTGGLGKVALGLISVAIGIFLVQQYRRLADGDRVPAAALAMILAGALGNGLPRLFSSRGVADFIDLGWHGHRFFVFNVADIGVSVGGVLLAAWIIFEERRRPRGLA